MNGHVSGLETGVGGGEQSSLYKAVIAGEGGLGSTELQQKNLW